MPDDAVAIRTDGQEVGGFGQVQAGPWGVGEQGVPTEVRIYL